MMYRYMQTQPCVELGILWFRSGYVLGPMTLGDRKNLPESLKALAGCGKTRFIHAANGI
jgi:hypothetical protein